MDVLIELEHWLKDKQGHQIFWLNGLAGTGKSTIAQTFAETSFQMGFLVQVSFAQEILRLGVTSNPSSPPLHSNLHTATPNSERSCSKS